MISIVPAFSASARWVAGAVQTARRNPFEDRPFTSMDTE